MIGKVKLTYEITYRPQDVSEDKHISYNEFLSIINDRKEDIIADINEAIGLVPIKITTTIKEGVYNI
jgi:hypothetical protein